VLEAYSPASGDPTANGKTAGLNFRFRRSAAARYRTLTETSFKEFDGSDQAKRETVNETFS
jgi:hypothetical protein